MRLAFGRAIFIIGVLGASGAAAAVQSAPATARPAGPYMVAEGSHSESASPVQQLTVLCPGGRKAFGAGFSAVMRTPPKTQGGPPGQVEGGLNEVRSFPDGAGTGWQVSGVSPDAARLKLPWRLVVRVVCMQVPGG